MLKVGDVCIGQGFGYVLGKLSGSTGSKGPFFPQPLKNNPMIMIKTKRIL